MSLVNDDGAYFDKNDISSGLDLKKLAKHKLETGSDISGTIRQSDYSKYDS